jgi:hypothetical protein
LVPEGSVAEVMERVVGAMTSETWADLICVGLDESATDAVKLKVPLTVGVPETMPVVALMLSPAGRLPEVTDHV